MADLGFWSTGPSELADRPLLRLLLGRPRGSRGHEAQLSRKPLLIYLSVPALDSEFLAMIPNSVRRTVGAQLMVKRYQLSGNLKLNLRTELSPFA